MTRSNLSSEIGLCFMFNILKRMELKKKGLFKWVGVKVARNEMCRESKSSYIWTSKIFVKLVAFKITEKYLTMQTAGEKKV